MGGSGSPSRAQQQGTVALGGGDSQLRPGGVLLLNSLRRLLVAVNLFKSLLAGWCGGFAAQRPPQAPVAVDCEGGEPLPWFGAQLEQARLSFPCAETTERAPAESRARALFPLGLIPLASSASSYSDACSWRPR
jgi:hypothetical protein